MFGNLPPNIIRRALKVFPEMTPRIFVCTSAKQAEIGSLCWSYILRGDRCIIWAACARVNPRSKKSKKCPSPGNAISICRLRTLVPGSPYLCIHVFITKIRVTCMLISCYPPVEIIIEASST